MLKKDCSASRAFRVLYSLNSATPSRERFTTRWSSVASSAATGGEWTTKKPELANFLSDQFK